MEILLSVTAKIAEYTVKPIVRQLGYLCYYNKNISGLSEEVGNLKLTRDSVKRSVDEAERNAEVMDDVVKKWFDDTDRIINSYEMLIHANGSQESKKCCSSALCLNLVQRHQKSRKATKMTVEVLKIITKGNFGRVAHRVPLPNDVLKVSGFMSFGSRESIITEIMVELMDDNVNMIGVYGMGGTGKTMLAKEIIRRVMENKSFDEAAMSAVSQTHDFEKIQDELAEMLGLKFKEEKTIQGRANKLHMRLKNGKKILIVLDDIWKDIDLDKIGIPREDNKGCKILFTSRNKNTLSSMGAEKTFDVQVLKQEESRELFNKMAGGVVVGSDEEQIAVQIVEECAHLPILITIVAKALRGKQLPIWKDALRELGHPVSMNLNNEEINERVYTSLKLSYQHLGSRSEAQSVFLLCSMFPEDHHINVEDLYVYAMGMDFLKGIKTLADGRNRTLKLVDDLKSSSLLQETEYGDGYVKMHDIVRHVAILIASEDDRICTLSYIGQGLNDWPEEKSSGAHTVAYLRFKNSPNPQQKLILPNIQLLMLTGSYDNKPELSGTLFEEKKELKVLELKDMRISLSPPSLQSFANLRSLRLLDCDLEDVDMSSVELNKLEILSFRGSNITEIPMVISQSKHLKVLDLSSCNKLKVIPPDLLSNLTKLEELFLGSFNGWEEENINRERKNASLCELKHLSRLSDLSISIPNEKIMPKQLISRELNLEKFDITIGTTSYRYLYLKNFRTLRLHMESESPLDDWIKMLLKRVEDLYLEGHTIEKFLHLEYEFDEIHFSHLKNLHLGNMTEVNHVIRESKKAFWKILTNLESIEIKDCMMLEVVFVFDIEEAANKLELIHLKSLSLEELPGLISFSSKIEQLNNSKKVGTLFNNQVSLPNLETLKIFKVTNLKRICDKVLIPGSSFAKLKSLDIIWCDNLEIVFPSNMMSILNCLEHLTISNCKSIEGIFEVEEPNAIEQCRESLLPRLSSLYLKALPNLKYVWREDVENIKMICQKVVISDSSSFARLRFLEIEGCDNLEIVFPSNMMSILNCLEDLTIRDCKSLEGIFEVEEPNETEQCRESLFPRLRYLTLRSLPNLKYVWREDPQELQIFENVERFSIKKCPKLIKRVYPVKLLQKLEELEIGYGELMETIEKVEMDETHSHQGELWEGEVLLPKLQNLTLWGSLNYKRTHFPKQLERIFLNLTELDVREILIDEIFPIAQMPTLRNLFRLIIHKCNGLTHLLNPQLAATLVRLQSMELSGCKMLTSVISQGSTDEEEIVFTKLGRLELDDLPRLTCFHSGKCIIGFPCLYQVEIKNCPEMKVFSLGTATTPCLTKMSLYWSKSLGIEYDPCESSEKNETVELRDDPNLLPKLIYLKLSTSILNFKWTHFPMEIVPKLHTLEVLEVRGLFVEEIFPNCPNAQSHRLRWMELYKLPKLKHLWKENSQMNTLMLLNLEYLTIEECGRLKSIVPSSVSSLRNLRNLIIHKCHGLTHLLNPHMATTLVQLQYMKLSECKMMTTLIAHGLGDGEEIIFPELKYLVIVDLPRLASFHSGKYIFRFPSLESVEIIKCQEMKVFSKGVTATPCLKMSVLQWTGLEKEDRKDIKVEDINVIIRQAWENIYDSSIQHLFTENASLPDLDYTPQYTPSGFRLSVNKLSAPI